MGKNINVESFDEMAKASKKLQEISDSYTSISKQLMQEASTMSTAWEGADNLAFVEKITGFTEELQAMAAALSNASQIIEQQRVNYVDRQDDNIVVVGKLAN